MSKVLLATAPPLHFATEDAGRFDLPGGNYAAQIATFSPGANKSAAPRDRSL